MQGRYVVDTTSIISYFSEVFGKPSQISNKGLSIIEAALIYEDVVLIIPSIVFVEIFKKWFVTEEMSQKIRYEVFERIRGRANIEIKPIELEVLENFILITDIEENHKFDNHDKQVLACAMMLQCPLITSDSRIIRYNQRKKVIPEIIE